MLANSPFMVDFCDINRIRYGGHRLTAALARLLRKLAVNVCVSTSMVIFLVSMFLPCLSL
jgi:hypothetical protein